jgi:diguanylate cyclase (GGDEF)-like protein
MDRLTGVYNRETMLSMLFRETDRVQRMKSSLCMILFDIDDFGHWNSRLGADACDELLCQVVAAPTRLLRSYDLLGRPGMDEFLMALPGCTSVNAVMLAERLRIDVFSRPSTWPANPSASPPALASPPATAAPRWSFCAKPNRPCRWPKPPAPNPSSASTAAPNASAAPVTFLSDSTSGDELLAW